MDILPQISYCSFGSMIIVGNLILFGLLIMQWKKFLNYDFLLIYSLAVADILFGKIFLDYLNLTEIKRIRSSHTHTGPPTHAHTHTHARTRTHKHTHTSKQTNKHKVLFSRTKCHGFLGLYMLGAGILRLYILRHENSIRVNPFRFFNQIGLTEAEYFLFIDAVHLLRFIFWALFPSPRYYLQLLSIDFVVWLLGFRPEFEISLKKLCCHTCHAN